MKYLTKKYINHWNNGYTFCFIPYDAGYRYML